MNVLAILVQVGETLFQMLPAIEKYGPQIVADLQQDWEMLVILAENGGVPTQEQHDRVIANLDRAHQEFQANTADVDDIDPPPTGDSNGQ